LKYRKKRNRITYEVNIIANQSSATIFPISTNDFNVYTFGGSIDLTSATGGRFTAYQNQHIHTGTKILLDNSAGGGYDDGASGNASTFIGCFIVGGGTSCSVIYGNDTQKGSISNCKFSGTFITASPYGIHTSTSAFTGNIINITGSFYSGGGKITANEITASGGILVNTQPQIVGNKFNSAVTNVTGGAVTHNIQLIGNYFASTYTSLSGRPTYANNNIFVGAVIIADILHSSNNVYLSTITSSITTFHSNDRITGNVSYTASVICTNTAFSGTFTGSALVRATGCGFTGNVLISSTSNFSTCTFTGNVGVSTANVSINIQGCVFGGGLAGGGTSTLTLNAGVNRAIISGNQFDNAIVDNSGSGANLISNNITY